MWPSEPRVSPSPVGTIPSPATRTGDDPPHLSTTRWAEPNLKANPPCAPDSFLVASDIIPPAEKTKAINLPLVRGLAWIARLYICSRYFVACWTMWRGREMPSAGSVVVLVALLPRRV